MIAKHQDRRYTLVLVCVCGGGWRDTFFNPKLIKYPARLSATRDKIIIIKHLSIFNNVMLIKCVIV